MVRPGNGEKGLGEKRAKGGPGEVGKNGQTRTKNASQRGKEKFGTRFRWEDTGKGRAIGKLKNWEWREGGSWGEGKDNHRVNKIETNRGGWAVTGG